MSKTIVERPPHIAPCGDGFPGCLVALPALAVAWLRQLLAELWWGAGIMVDPESYGHGD